MIVKLPTDFVLLNNKEMVLIIDGSSNDSHPLMMKVVSQVLITAYQRFNTLKNGTPIGETGDETGDYQGNRINHPAVCGRHPLLRGTGAERG